VSCWSAVRRRLLSVSLIAVAFGLVVHPATSLAAGYPTTGLPALGWFAATSHGGGPLGSAPASGVDANGNRYIFWRGTDGSLWNEDYDADNAVWGRPVEVAAAGRTLAAAPAVAVLRDGQQDVFWKGTDGDLWETVDTSHWSPSVDLGAGPLGSAPTAGVDGDGGVYVFWEGTDGSLWEKWQLSGTWFGPAKITLAGRMGSAPAVAVQPSGVQNVFWRGTDGNLWDAWHTNAWHGPVNLGARPLGSAPAAAAGTQGNLFVFWEGTDGSLWEKSQVNATWNGATKVTTAGRMGSPPSVAVVGNTLQDVFWRGTNGNLWETWDPSANSVANCGTVNDRPPGIPINETSSILNAVATNIACGPARAVVLATLQSTDGQPPAPWRYGGTGGHGFSIVNGNEQIVGTVVN
jgi:hypothetical protein